MGYYANNLNEFVLMLIAYLYDVPSFTLTKWNLSQ